MSAASGSTASLGQVVGGLAGDVQDLVRGEIMLARAELDQKFHRVLMACCRASPSRSPWYCRLGRPR